MAYRPAATQDAVDRGLRCSDDALAFDAAEFHELSQMIGEEGVIQMIQIFENETRRRLRRLEAGDQDLATQLREMHTLKGAAGSVAAPRLTALGRTYEASAFDGVGPTSDDLGSIAAALEDWLAAVRAWIEEHIPGGPVQA